MRKNQKIVYAVILSCAILTSAITMIGANTIYSQASQENNSTDMSENPNNSLIGKIPATDKTPPEPPNGFDGNTPPNGQGMLGGGSSVSASYAAINTYTEDAEVSNKEMVSTGSYENIVLVQNGAKVTKEIVTIILQ